MNIILFGPTGAGKGTMADMLKEEFNLNKLSTGELFRLEIENNTEIGKQIKESMTTKSDLINDQTTLDIVNKHMKSDNNIFDGFPRNIEQAKWLSERIKIDKIIELKIQNESIIKRLSSRRVCPKCQSIYNLETEDRKPKQEGICDKCGTQLVIRPKDKPEIIKGRLEIYHNQTQPVIEFFKQKGLTLEEVNANQPPEDEYKELKQKLGLNECCA